MANTEQELMMNTMRDEMRDEMADGILQGEMDDANMMAGAQPQLNMIERDGDGDTEQAGDAPEPLAEPLSDDEVHTIVQGWLRISRGGEEDSGSILQQAMDYYMGKPRGDEIAGRSKQQSLDVADMVEASLSQITPMLTITNIASFDALNEKDEDQAGIESRFCNHVVMSRNNGYVVFHNAVKSGLLQRIAAVEVFVDTMPTVTEESYTKANQMVLKKALMPTQENEEVILVRMEDSGDEFDEDDRGNVTPFQKPVDFTVKRVVNKRKLVVEDILPGDLRWLDNSNVDNPQASLFVARRRLVSRSDMILKGFDIEKVNAVPAYTGGSVTQTSTNLNATYRADQAASDIIEVYNCYPMIDSDGDGIAERRIVTLAGNQGDHFLDNKPIDIVPIATGSPFLMPGRLDGLGIFDKLKSIQDGKTHSLRQWLDNQNHNNNRRLAINVLGLVDQASAIDSKPAGIMKFKRNPGECLMPVPVDDIGPSCMTLLGYFDNVTSHRVGSALDMQTQQQGIAGDTAHGIERQMSAKELMVSMMARNLGETVVRGTYMLVHHILRTQFNEPMNAKTAGQWEETTPTQWLPRDSITINIGMTKTERMREYGLLREQYDRQMALMQIGSPLVNPEKIHNTLSDLVEVSSDRNHERYYIDPASPQGMTAQQQGSQQAQHDKAIADKQQQDMIDAQVKLGQAEVLKAQSQLQRVQMQAMLDGLKQQLEEAKAMAAAAKEDASLEFDYEELYQNIMIDLMKLGQPTGQAANNVETQ